jgi:hypothetical protein
VCYDGSTVWVLPRARRALNHMLNYVDLSASRALALSPLDRGLTALAGRRSMTYEQRLHKYAQRGFAVAVPDMDMTRIDPSLFGEYLQPLETRGLMRLLLLDFEVCPCSVAAAGARVADGRR